MSEKREVNAPPLRLEGLVKSYSSGFGKPPLHAVNGLSLQVEKGEIFGFLGPNGAGKTTTIKMILNFIRPTRGEAFIFGRSAKNTSVKSRVGFLSENPVFYNFLTGYQTLKYFGRLFGLSGAEIAGRIDAIAEDLSLDLELRLPLSKLSKGMLQRVGLAQALINNPDLIILDEPMTGLDPLGRREFRDTILGLKEKGKTIFFSSHILSDIEMMCDRFSIMTKGRLREVGSMKEFFQEKGEKTILYAEGLPPAACEALCASGATAAREGTAMKLEILGGERIKEARRVIGESGARVVAEETTARTLEDHFIAVVRDTGGAA